MRRHDGAPAGGAAGEYGQALAELALVTPILVLLVMAIVQFAFVLQTQMGLTNAVREAARRAAAVANPTEAWVREQLCGTDPTGCWDPSCATPDKTSCPLLPRNVQGFDAARLTAGPIVVGGVSYAANPGIRFCTYDVSGTPNYRIDVVVRYGNPVFFPLLAYATDAADGTPDGAWTLDASAQMRLERDLATAPGTCG